MIIVSSALLLIAGIAFGMFSYFIGRLTMALDIRWQQKAQTKRVALHRKNK